ncbi:MAG: hypothetical protein AB1668_00900 [Nanoarchaeota archaeon]
MIKHSPFHRCIECDEIITNPLCTVCLAERMAMAVGEHNKKLAKAIRGFGPQEGTESGTRCISCGRGMNVCTHCFSKDTYEFLAEKNPAVAEEFLSQFDFDLRRGLA